MERMSLYSELESETGEILRISYRLTEEKDGLETRYGIVGQVEGSAPREDQRCVLPGTFGSRALAVAALQYLAEKGVSPQEMEDVLCEALP